MIATRIPWPLEHHMKWHTERSIVNYFTESSTSLVITDFQVRKTSLCGREVSGDEWSLLTSHKTWAMISPHDLITWTWGKCVSCENIYLRHWENKFKMSLNLNWNCHEQHNYLWVVKVLRKCSSLRTYDYIVDSLVGHFTLQVMLLCWVLFSTIRYGSSPPPFFFP